MKLEAYNKTFDEIGQIILSILSEADALRENRKVLGDILSVVDLTSLEGSDTSDRIISICEKAQSFHTLADGLPDVAAVCFYPPFIRLARHELKGTGIQVASVAGAFPSGQSPLSAKLEEVRFAVHEGADEIDTVISRGKLLEGDDAFVFDEIAAIKEACGQAHLKVILETGELGTVEHIRKASGIAIEAGADFIKTSTGKFQPAATKEAVFIMAETAREFEQKTGKRTGIKVAGGISTVQQAIEYMNIVRHVLGVDRTGKSSFRIGASRLTDNLVNQLKAYRD